MFVAFPRLPKSRVERQFRRGAKAKLFAFSERSSIFVQNWGASAFVEDLQKNERKTRNQGRNTNPSNERVEDASTMPVAREGLPCLEMSQELPFAGPHAPCAGRAAQSARDRRFLKFHVKKKLEINVFGIDCAVSIMDGPDLSEQRRKELALARLMAVSIGVMLYTGESDVDVRIDAAKDMIREFKHVYEETRGI